MSHKTDVKKKCSTNNNPQPPCPVGFVQKQNKKGEECCYKQTSKKKSPKQVDTKPEDIVIDTSNVSSFTHTTPKHNTNPEQWIIPNQPQFPSWITSTFIKYKKEVPKDDDVSCETKIERLTLFPHQRFIRDYLQYKSPYRGLLVYHGLGVGKSCSSIATAEMLINYKKVVIMLPASLKSNYVTEIVKCGNKYYDMKKHYWTFVQNMKVDYISKKVLDANKGVWVIDESKKSNYNDLSDDEITSLKRQIGDIIKHNYSFINYNGVSEKDIKEKYTNPNFFDNKVVIIDEVHNFISGVSNNSKITTSLYKLLMKSTNLKLILLSGTPIINTPNEIAYTINLLKGPQFIYTLEVNEKDEGVLSTILDNISQIDTYQIEIKSKISIIHITLLPNSFNKIHNKISFNDLNVLSNSQIIEGIINKLDSYKVKTLKVSNSKYDILPTSNDDFNKFFVDEHDLTMMNKNLFMRRIMGSVSHFVNNDPRLYPTMSTINEEIPMSNYQYEKYVNARKEEKKLELKKKSTSLFGKQISVYKTYSRSICNFVFPENINRPKPKDIKDLKNNKKKEEYLRQINVALKALTNDHLSKDLSTYSPKFKKMIENISKSQGTVLIYSQFSSVEGIEIISRCLDLVGYAEFKILYKNNEWNIDFDPNKKGYIKFKSDLNLDERKKNEYNNILLSIYNNDLDNLPKYIRSKLGDTNLRGEIIKILFITQSGAEGISLKNVRQVHITEPYWNKNRIDQVIGRANRTCSHIALPKNERNFVVYTYTMIMTDKQLAVKDNRTIVSRYDKNMTTDQFVYNIANNKHKIINQFLECMKKASVDCSLNNPEIGCFTFPVDLIENNKAYTIDINKDTLDGFNKNATIDVKKKAVKVFVKSLNKHFIYIEDTHELFDYTLYMTTNVLNMVGHMKPLENKKYVITLF